MGRATGGRCTVALLLFVVVAIAAACDDGAAPAATATPRPPTQTAAATPTRTAAPQTPAEPPGRDLIDLARRFHALPADAPRLARLTPYAQQVGDSQRFTIIDLETPAMLAISATLRLVTEHAYLFVQDGISVPASDLEALGGDFETRVYPVVTAAFGAEWSPGVDSDPHIVILHAQLKGAGGYVNAADEFPAAVAIQSNEREMVYLDTSFLDAQGPAYNAVAAHELQHLVHWNADPDEEAWVNEGLSQVASEMVGGGTAGLQSFLISPDTQLNHWPAEGDTGVHYAASQLFFRYLLDRFGGREQASRLLRIQEDGITGVETYLRSFAATFPDVFADWLAANYLDEENGPYAHADADARVATVTTIRELGEGNGSVHQFAAEYLEVEPPADGFATFTFDGADEVSIGVPPHDGPPSAGSGQAFWWSSRGDAIDSRLTREFDLTGLQRATLRYWTWFDIERGWDYAYVAASTDGGKSWRTLPGRQTSDYNPVGQAYGPGYTGTSGEDGPQWVREEVDLTPYAGRKLLLRFEYVTDDSANLTGFAVDDIEVPELRFQDGAHGDGGWTAEGFRRIEEPLSQQFILLLIDRSQSPASVQRVAVSAGNHAEVLLGNAAATIVVAAVTEGTTDIALYRWSLAAQ